MTTKSYLKILKTLGLSPHSKRTAAALGVSLSTAQRFAMGWRIHGSTERLLSMYVEHGLPAEYQSEE